MNDLSSLIDNVYSGVDLDSASSFICDPDNLNKELTIKNSSRYKVSGLNYSPYKLNSENFSRIINNIYIIPNLEDTDSEFVIDYDCNKLVIREPKIITKLLYEGSITPNGLLAIRLSRCFGNREFRSIVNHMLAEFMTYYQFGNERIFIQDDICDLVEKYESDTKLVYKLLTKYGWKWRD